MVSLNSLVAQMVKNLPEMQENQVWSLGWEDPLKKGIVTAFCILVWKIPWTEEPGGLQSMGPQWAGHDRAHTHTHTHIYIKLSQFGVSQKLTQQCKSTVLKKEKEKKTRNVRRIKERITVCVRRMCMYFSFSEIIRVRCGGDVKQFPGHTKTHQQRVES